MRAMVGGVVMILAMLIVVPLGLLFTGAVWAALFGELAAGAEGKEGSPD